MRHHNYIISTICLLPKKSLKGLELAWALLSLKSNPRSTLSHPSPPFSFFKIWVCKLNSYTFVLGQTAQDTCAWPAPGNDNIISLSIPLMSNKRNVTADDWWQQHWRPTKNTEMKRLPLVSDVCESVLSLSNNLSLKTQCRKVKSLCFFLLLQLKPQDLICTAWKKTQLRWPKTAAK